MHHGPWEATRGLLAVLILVLAGCAAREPAPVDGWDWTGPVPEGYYLVREGDTLSEVAERQRIRFSRLASWNNLKPPYTIFSGRLLRIVPPEAPTGLAHTGGGTSPTRTGAAGRAGTSGRAPPANAGSRRAASGVAWEWPLNGPLLQGFREGERTRQGLRIGGRPGDLARAAAAGTVVYSGGGLKGYGNLIIVKHSDKYLSAYGFNRRLLVREGESVRGGQALAEVGEGPGGIHLLHFEIRRDGTAVDPILYLPPRS